jgi:hypothetical protein
MRRNDLRGLPVSTHSTVALERYERAAQLREHAAWAMPGRHKS